VPAAAAAAAAETHSRRTPSAPQVLFWTLFYTLVYVY